MNDMPLKAECSCGQLSVSCAEQPVRVSLCHCHACQKRSGSVFAVQASFNESTVSISGKRNEYVRTADSGNLVRFYFCPTCGNTLFYKPEARLGIIAVPVGNFANADFPAPTISVYEARQHNWVSVPEEIEHLN